jgi:hypothetical protein
VLLYDLRNIKSNPESEERTLQTTHELYISAPYFRDEEAEKISKATVSLPPPTTDLGDEEESWKQKRGPEKRAKMRESTIEDGIEESSTVFYEGGEW